MNHLDTKQLRAAIAEYKRPSTAPALLIFATDLVMYASAIAGLILLENTALKILCSIAAGSLISSLFVIGHDAAHDAFTGSRILNRIIARIAFLPSLHNFGLWLTEHNRIHHQSVNIKGMDSWSPFSKEEYDSLPAWRQIVERFYRNPAGICFYYLIERWWKNKFFPYERIPGKYNSVYWDFLLVIIYLANYLWLLVYVGLKLPHTGPVELVILGFLIPFFYWNFMMGFTVYQHHTHECIVWTKTRNERDQIGGQENFTMHVRFPRWYDLMSHNIMYHTAHHVDPRIPFYRLPMAQQLLARLLGNDLKTVRFTVKGFLQTMAKCKLYDFENHCWLDFNGNPTSGTNRAVEEDYYINAA